MLLNEFLKEHKRVEDRSREQQEQRTTIDGLKTTVAKQEAIIAHLKSGAVTQEATISELERGIGMLTAQIKEQAAKIQSVSARLELRRPALRTTANDTPSTSN